MGKILNMLCAVALLACPMCVCAQEADVLSGEGGGVPPTKDSDFYFVYIDHEPGTPRRALVDKLDEIHKSALDYNNALIVYLANEDEPLVSFTNIKDPEGTRDKEDAYEAICQELQSAPFHNASLVDADNIPAIIGSNGVQPLFNPSDEEDPMLFRSVKMMFFVGQRFWRTGYNEDVIAQLYISLNLDKYMKRFGRNMLSFEIWRDKDAPLPGEGGPVPFGRHNRGDINNNQKIKFYSYPN